MHSPGVKKGIYMSVTESEDVRSNMHVILGYGLLASDKYLQTSSQNPKSQ